MKEWLCEDCDKQPQKCDCTCTDGYAPFRSFREKKEHE